jgi:hypothetical protein
MLGSALVRDPTFQDRVVAETRALLASSSQSNGGEMIAFTPASSSGRAYETRVQELADLTNQ